MENPDLRLLVVNPTMLQNFLGNFFWRAAHNKCPCGVGGYTAKPPSDSVDLSRPWTKISALRLSENEVVPVLREVALDMEVVEVIVGGVTVERRWLTVLEWQTHVARLWFTKVDVRSVSTL